jgi:hypothetical protein
LALVTEVANREARGSEILSKKYKNINGKIQNQN